MKKYDRNLPYNELPLLPPIKKLDENPKILQKLVTASRALGTLDGIINQLPNPSILVNTIALQEAKTSTEIENIFTTDDELYHAISSLQDEIHKNPATKEVLKYRESIWEGYNYIQEKQTIDAQLLIHVCSKIKDSKLDFRSPHALIVIRKGNSDLTGGEVVYTPPRDEKKIKELIENLIEFIHDDETYPLDPLLKMCISHYQFEAIHPFHDGNGRTGRILNTLILINKGLLSFPVLYTSRYIIVNKDSYYFNLGAVTQRNDWESWVLFMLDAVEKTADYTISLIKQIIQQMDSTLQYAQERLPWYTKELNEALFTQPYIKAHIVGDVLQKSSRTTISKYLGELTKYQILSSKKIGKEVVYVNHDLARIIEN